MQEFQQVRTFHFELLYLNLSIGLEKPATVLFIFINIFCQLFSLVEVLLLDLEREAKDLDFLVQNLYCFFLSRHMHHFFMIFPPPLFIFFFLDPSHLLLEFFLDLNSISSINLATSVLGVNE